MLDYGCGVGRLAGWVAARGARAVGTDPSAPMLERAREAVPGARFVETRLDGVPDEIGRDFDLVLSVQVLQYTASQPHRLTSLLTALRAVLRPDGLFAALEQVQDSGRDQGASLRTYEMAFADAGMKLERHRIVRLSDSFLLALAMRRPRLTRLPGLELAVELAARRREGALVDGRYAEYLFMARK